MLELAGLKPKKWKRASVLYPKSREEILTILQQAHANRTSLTFIGGEFPSTNGKKQIVISLCKLNSITLLDLDNARVTVEGGIYLQDLVYQLMLRNLTLQLTGDLPDITALDAIAVDVCGSSCLLGDCLVGCEILLPDGSTIEMNWQEHSASLRAVIGGLGVAGVVLRTTFQCVPLFLMQEITFQCPLSDLVSHWKMHTQASQSISVEWFPVLDQVLVTHCNPIRLHLAFPQPLWKKLMESFFETVTSLVGLVSKCACHLFPELVRRHCKVQHWLAWKRAYLHSSHCYPAQRFVPANVFCQGIRWVIPTKHFSLAMWELIQWGNRHPHLCTSPLHVQFLCRSDKMEPMQERGALLTAVSHSNTFTVWVDWFRLPTKGFSLEQAEFEALLQSYGGRKSWASGPVFVSPFLVSQMYPGYMDWCKLRRKMDSAEFFHSGYVKGLLYTVK